jgi:hypothetical protein
VVRREEERGAQSCAQREEPAVARLPRGSFSGPGAKLEPLDFAPQSEGCGKGRHPLGDRGALRLDPVVRVRHHELALCGLAPMEEIEEDEGVETPGDGDERRAPGQLQGVEVGSKLGREVHRGKVNLWADQTPSLTSTSERWTRVIPWDVSTQR